MWGARAPKRLTGLPQPYWYDSYAEGARCCWASARNSSDEFDWSFNPSLPKKQIFDLATCRFVRENRDALLIGPPGVGKSFVAQAIGYQAIKQGFLVLYRSIFDVVRDFLHEDVSMDTKSYEVRDVKCYELAEQQLSS